MIQKPPHGAPCNDCGLCCMDSVCPLGQIALGPVAGPCPALRMTDAGSHCDLLRHPASYFPIQTVKNGSVRVRAAIAVLIGAGAGCDAQVEGEPYDSAFGRRTESARYAATARAARRVLEIEP